MTDLLAATAELVDIASVSHHERAIADHLEERLRAVPWLRVDRVGGQRGGPDRTGPAVGLILAGHTDTVPPNGNDQARLDGNELWGLGSADMKAGLAVMLELAASLAAPATDVTYAFYACEEVAREHNGLSRLFALRPDLLAGDVAILVSRPTAPWRPGARGAQGGGDPAGRAGPLGPAVDGRQRHPPPGPLLDAVAASPAGNPRWTAAGTGRPCRPSR